MQLTKPPLQVPWHIKPSSGISPWETFFRKAQIVDFANFSVTDFVTSRGSKPVTILFYGNTRDPKGAGPTLQLQNAICYPRLGVSTHVPDLEKALPLLEKNLHASLGYATSEVGTVTQISLDRVEEISTLHFSGNESMLDISVIISNAQITYRLLIFPVSMSTDINLYIALEEVRGDMLLDHDHLVEEDSLKIADLLTGESLHAGKKFRDWLENSFNRLEEAAKNALEGFAISAIELFLTIDHF